MATTRIEQGSSDYPVDLTDRLGENAPPCLYAMGELSILRHRLLGLVCSVQCPGSVVIKTLDAIRSLREEGVVVIGGFHSPMERECLDILLRGDQPVILCPARTLRGARLGRRARQALDNGQLLLLSPFDDSVRRTTVPQAMIRNELVATIADALFVPHAAPGGKTWTILDAACRRGQAVYTLEDQRNEKLIESGCEHLPRPFRRSVF